ncbi:hypothetical protein SeLEV6574_g07762 [Synchytrium endobioticum]|uniref:VTT domain-containing protein n=1 Tax=Synchytrium endobioticum TaxID=286115 RepID=A0A507CJL5_9FUNG|nr:hypothetical protein SeLEV6574_g07762 [Synchytrium endobioticum]
MDDDDAGASAPPHAAYRAPRSAHRDIQRMLATQVEISAKPHRPAQRQWIVRIAIVTAAALVLLAVYLGSRQADIKGNPLLPLLKWIGLHKGIGSVVFVLLFGVLTCLLIPAFMLEGAAGILFRPWPLAAAVIVAGTQVGVVIAFLLGRSILRPWIHSKLANDVRFVAVDRGVSREGWKIPLLLRLQPIIPFGICSYILSMTAIELPTVLWATGLGSAPGAVLYAFLGSLAGDLTGADDIHVNPRTKYLTMLISGCVIAITVVFITLVARRSLREAFSEGADSLHRESTSVSQSLLSPTGDSSSRDVNGENSSLSRNDSSLVDIDDDDDGPLLGSPNRVSAAAGDIITTAIGVDGEDAGGDESTRRSARFTRRERAMLYGTFAAAAVTLAVGVPLILTFIPPESCVQSRSTTGESISAGPSKVSPVGPGVSHKDGDHDSAVKLFKLSGAAIDHCEKFARHDKDFCLLVAKRLDALASCQMSMSHDEDALESTEQALLKLPDDAFTNHALSLECLVCTERHISQSHTSKLGKSFSVLSLQDVETYRHIRDCIHPEAILGCFRESKVTYSSIRSLADYFGVLEIPSNCINALPILLKVASLRSSPSTPTDVVIVYAQIGFVYVTFGSTEQTGVALVTARKIWKVRLARIRHNTTKLLHNGNSLMPIIDVQLAVSRELQGFRWTIGADGNSPTTP